MLNSYVRPLEAPQQMTCSSEAVWNWAMGKKGRKREIYKEKRKEIVIRHAELFLFPSWLLHSAVNIKNKIQLHIRQ